MNTLPALNFPAYQFRFSTLGDQQAIYDTLRKKFVLLTPEEWVRQHMVRYLVEQKRVPPSLITVEKVFRIFKLKRRFDIAVYASSGQPLLLVECKAPGVTLNQDTFDQVSRYNLALHARYLVITNGLSHHCCRLDYETQSWEFLKEIPSYFELL